MKKIEDEIDGFKDSFLYWLGQAIAVILVLYILASL